MKIFEKYRVIFLFSFDIFLIFAYLRIFFFCCVFFLLFLPASYFLFFASQKNGWEASVMGWEDSVVCWEDSVVGWEDPGHFFERGGREKVFFLVGRPQ